MEEPIFIKVCLDRPKLNFCSSLRHMTREEIKEDLIGSVFDFGFKGEGTATCIDVHFP